MSAHYNPQMNGVLSSGRSSSASHTGGSQIGEIFPQAPIADASRRGSVSVVSGGERGGNGRDGRNRGRGRSGGHGRGRGSDRGRERAGQQEPLVLNPSGTATMDIGANHAPIHVHNHHRQSDQARTPRRGGPRRNFEGRNPQGASDTPNNGLLSQIVTQAWPAYKKAFQAGNAGDARFFSSNRDASS